MPVWHVVLYTCAVTGAICWALIFLLVACLYRDVRRFRKRREGERRLAGALLVAGAEAMLRDAAGDTR
jgi:hypothetical protein